jgi:hypothetical protein
MFFSLFFEIVLIHVTITCGYRKIPATGKSLMQAVLFPPADPAQWDTCRSQLHQWRTITRDLIGYDGSSYALPAFAWASRTFALGFLMMFDLQFDDPRPDNIASMRCWTRLMSLTRDLSSPLSLPKMNHSMTYTYVVIADLFNTPIQCTINR